MKSSLIGCLFLAILLGGCAGTRIEVEPLIQDFARYETELQDLGVQSNSEAFLDTGREKRTAAQDLVNNGKEKVAFPLMQKALADAQVALDLENMNAAQRDAESCRLQVEQARKRWEEAVLELEKTEDFVGMKMFAKRSAPTLKEDEPVFPATTLDKVQYRPDGDLPGRMEDWRQAAADRRIAIADLETNFERHHARIKIKDVKPEELELHSYIASRVVQSMECRVRRHSAEQSCLHAAKLAAMFGDAREEALQATLGLERGLQDDLRDQLDRTRDDAKERQNEIFAALSQLEGKYASIRRDARGTIVSLPDILFDFDKATLKRDVEFSLVKIATILNQFAEMGILIEGHTDSIGTDEYNLDLSKQRAQAVYEFLVSQKVVPGRMAWEGYGEDRPVDDNGTDEGRQKNRRVDLVIQDAP